MMQRMLNVGVFFGVLMGLTTVFAQGELLPKMEDVLCYNKPLEHVASDNTVQAMLTLPAPKNTEIDFSNMVWSVAGVYRFGANIQKTGVPNGLFRYPGGSYTSRDGFDQGVIQALDLEEKNPGAQHKIDDYQATDFAETGQWADPVAARAFEVQLEVANPEAKVVFEKSSMSLCVGYFGRGNVAITSLRGNAPVAGLVDGEYSSGAFEDGQSVVLENGYFKEEVTLSSNSFAAGIRGGGLAVLKLYLGDDKNSIYAAVVLRLGPKFDINVSQIKKQMRSTEVEGAIGEFDPRPSDENLVFGDAGELDMRVMTLNPSFNLVQGEAGFEVGKKDFGAARFTFGGTLAGTSSTPLDNGFTLSLIKHLQ